jgi:hypothetical protein
MTVIKKYGKDRETEERVEDLNTVWAQGKYRHTFVI